MTNIGFGCASIAGLNSRKSAIEILEHAYNSGIAHFDVARLYGMGLTENLVGEFARNKRDKITITSKFGLNPPQIIFQKSGSYQILKKIIKGIPIVHRIVKRKIDSKVESVFTVENARTSLEKTLTELNTDYIDYYLLHEAGIDDANTEELIYFLQQKVKEGKILKFGIGSAFQNLNDDCALFRPEYSIFQFENNIFNNNLFKLKNKESKLIITHSVFKDFEKIANYFSKSNLTYLESELEMGKNELQKMRGMLLYYSSLINPQGITLFSSTKMENITSNLKYFEFYKNLKPMNEVLDTFIAEITGIY